MTFKVENLNEPNVPIDKQVGRKTLWKKNGTIFVNLISASKSSICKRIREKMLQLTIHFCVRLAVYLKLNILYTPEDYNKFPPCKPP